MRQRALLLVFLTQLSCLHPSKQVSALDRDHVISTVLNLRDADFFQLSESSLQQCESRLLESEFTGIALNAPKSIDTKSHEKLPLLVAVRSTGERGWRVPLKLNCLLVATSLDNGQVLVAPGLADTKEVSPRTRKTAGAPDKAPANLPLVAAQITPIDARARLQTTWGSGRWSFGVINFDWCSNIVEVRLTGDSIASIAVDESVLPVSDSTGYPSYRKNEKSPAAPADGVTFTVDYNFEQEQRRLIVHGSFAIPIRLSSLVNTNLQVRNGSLAADEPIAVVPITFLIVGLNQDQPLKCDWRVPVFGEQLKAGEIARGYFALNALEGSSQSLEPGKYATYIVANGLIYGPQTFEIPTSGK